MDDKLTIFIAVTAAAVVLQMLLLAAMFFTIRKLSAHLQTVTGDLQSRVYPILDEVKPTVENLKGLEVEVKALLESSRPKLDVILDNAAQMTTTARGDLERIEATLNDIVDRTRLQVIRADELVTRTLDKLEEATEKVQHSVLSPVKKMSGILSGLNAGINAYVSGQKRPRNGGGPNDEMFI